MQKPKSVEGLTKFGRVRLSKSFFMRDFLFSDIAEIHGFANVPDNPDLAIRTGTWLCEDILEPLQDVFGRIAIRSAYRSAEVNGFGSKMTLAKRKGYNCASNADNTGGHIWDLLATDGSIGATACIVVPSFWDAFPQPGDWQKLAWWIHDHLPYSSMYFHPKYWAFNITWSDRPAFKIGSYPKPTGILTKSGMGNNTDSHEASWTGIVEAANGLRGRVRNAVGESLPPVRTSDVRPPLPAALTRAPGARADEATVEPTFPVDGADAFPPPQALEEALSRLVLSKAEQAMLTAHLAAPDYILSASELATAAGYSGFSAANVAYGKLGHRLSDQLGWLPTEQNVGIPVWTYALATDADVNERAASSGRTRLRGTWRLRLRPELVAI